jgi:hypothetical protein
MLRRRGEGREEVQGGSPGRRRSDAWSGHDDAGTMWLMESCLRNNPQVVNGIKAEKTYTIHVNIM